MSKIEVDTVAEKTSANGVTVDGLNIKDSKLVTANSVVETNLTDNIVTLAKMASGTDGNIISYDASGNPVAIATGSDGQVLTSTGAGSPPAFETPAGGGKVLQVVFASHSTEVSSTSSTHADTGLTGAITPSATNSKVLIFINMADINKQSADTGISLKLLRGSTAILEFAKVILNTGQTQELRAATGANFLDSPSTTNATTYKVTFNNTSGSGTTKVQANGATSTMTLIEIGA